MLGDAPALSPPELLDRRLLAGDPHEATERAEDYLRTHSLAAFYDDVAVPALGLAEADRAEFHLTEEQRVRVGDSAFVLIDNLAEWEGNGTATPETAEGEAADDGLSKLQGRQVLCAGARGNLDDVAAAMLAQLLERHGADVRTIEHDSLQTTALGDIDLKDPEVVVLSYLNADLLAHARFLVRRLRRRLPKAAIVVGLWTFPPTDAPRRDPLEASGADRVATSLRRGYGSRRRSASAQSSARRSRRLRSWRSASDLTAATGCRLLELVKRDVERSRLERAYG